MVDPGTSDPTGIVGIDGDLAANKIKVKLARQITEPVKYKRYRETRDYLKLLQRKIRPDVMGIETNNRGRDLYIKLKMHGIRLEGINTCGDMNFQNTLKGHAMDKPHMTGWTARAISEQVIEFPEKGLADMDELINQIHTIKPFISPNGSTQYRAMNSRHDDLWSAFLLCCYVFFVMKHRWDIAH